VKTRAWKGQGWKDLRPLTWRKEVFAIAEHEQIPEMAATTLTEYLTHQEHGTEKFVR
jgi:hypothetical protein